MKWSWGRNFPYSACRIVFYKRATNDSAIIEMTLMLAGVLELISFQRASSIDIEEVGVGYENNRFDRE